MNGTIAGFVFLGVLSAGLAFAAEGAKQRQPQFPLKTARTLVTDEQIAMARANMAQFPSAKARADSTVRSADPWLDWSDEDLRALIPSAEVPRAFNVGTAGCPKCGQAIYEKGGTYPWIIDPRKPFKVECPVDGSVYPGNDFEAYYRGGFQDETKLEGEYADDGWGWVGPDGERYWFVAYANHWTWHSHIRPALLNLGRAYVLTGDKRYAHKAAVMLDRIAEVYPSMDYHNQSRYGQLQGARGSHYGGKIVNWIWETGFLASMAESYDAVWETIDGDDELQRVAGRTGEEIRAHIEANILEEGIDGIFAGEIRGNFGMHQRALVYAALARQHGKTDAWLGGLFTDRGTSALHTGLNYALYNLVYRDGMPYETSPGYCFSWVSNITTVAETLRRAGREDLDVYRLPKTKRLYDAVLDMHNIGRFTPSLGDSGSVYGGKVGLDAGVFQAAYRAYGNPRLLRHLASFGAIGDAGFETYETLFLPAVAGDAGEPLPEASRLMDGYGMAILNNAKDTVSVSMYYGYTGGHGHFDRLHFDLFANEQPMMPDLGYPDFMNAYVSGIYTWSKNTIGHNTVTVDASRQSENHAGAVRLFADGPFARVVDVDAAETYPECSTYHRRLVMVDVDADRSYVVDAFTVVGGSQHDYSLHGPPGAFQVIGGAWTEQPKGTLAGEDVELGELYDDPVLGAEGYDAGYSGYTGSGFQHLFNVQRGGGDGWVAEWSHERDPDARLRIRVLDQPGQEIILADAQVSPIKHKQLIKYVIARRQGEALASRFVSVIEPFRGEPFIRGVRRLDLDAGEGLAVAVDRDDGSTDLVLQDATGSQKALSHYALETDAVSAVVTFDGHGRSLRAYFAGGTSLSVGEDRFAARPAPAGEVVAVAPDQREIRVRLAGAEQAVAAESLAGRVVHFENAIRRTAHPIESARLEGGHLVLTTQDDLLVGRACLTAIEEATLRTDTAFMFAPVYRGTVVFDEQFTACYRVSRVDGGAIELAEPLPEGHPFTVDRDAWIVNVGPGDRLDVPSAFHWERVNNPGN